MSHDHLNSSLSKLRNIQLPGSLIVDYLGKLLWVQKLLPNLNILIYANILGKPKIMDLVNKLEQPL